MRLRRSMPPIDPLKFILYSLYRAFCYIEGFIHCPPRPAEVCERPEGPW